jgi:hypothetical protein
MHVDPSKLTGVLARAVFALGALLVAATADAEFVRVTAANSVGNSVYDVTSFTPPPGPGTISPLNTDGASHGSFSSLVQVANLITDTVDVLVADAGKGQIIRYTPAVGATPASETVEWSHTNTGPANPDGLSLDAAGNLYLVQQNKPSVWVLPVSTTSSTGYAASPLLIDSNGYSSFGDQYLRETAVATTAGPAWNAGDLLVLGSSKNASNKSVLFVYRAASVLSVLNGAGARNGPDVVLMLPGQFTFGGNPVGMDFWPPDSLDSNPTLLVTTTAGQVLRLDFTHGTSGFAPTLVQVFATGLGSGLLKVKEGLQLETPYAFVTQTLAGNSGQILQLGAPGTSGSTNLIGIATLGVHSPDALAVARQAATPASACVFPNVCDLSGGVLPHQITLTGSQSVSGNVVEGSCVILSDPRVKNGVCDGTNLAVSTLPCPGDFGNEIIPGTMCGGSGASGAGFALLRTIAPGVDGVPGLLVYTQEDVDRVLPPTAPATNPPCPSALLAWAPWSDANPSEGTIVETDSQTGLAELVETTGFCDNSGGSSRGLSIYAVGLTLNVNALSGGLTGFAQTKYNNLFATVTGANIVSATQTALETSLGVVNTYLGQGDYACAAVQVLNVDAQVAGDPNPAADYPGNAANPNPWGEIRGRLANLYLTLNTRILGNPANFAWPLATSDARPVCAPPAVTLTATPASISPGASAKLSWSTQHATSCQAATNSADPAWGTAQGTSGSYTTVGLNGNNSYTLNCAGAGGPTSATVTVTVVPPPQITTIFTATPASVAAGGSSTLTWVATAGASCSVAGLSGTTSPLLTGPIGATTTYTLTCMNSLNVSVTETATVTVVPVPAIASFTAGSLSVGAGASTTLSWVETTGASCSVAGLSGTTSPVSTGPISTTTTYTLTCRSVGGTVSQKVTVTVVPPPKITSFTANPSNIDPDCVRDGHPSSCSSTTLTWASSNAVSCAIVGGSLNRTGLLPSGSLNTGTITAATTYALGCSNSVNVTTSAKTTVTYKDLDDGTGD